MNFFDGRWFKRNWRRDWFSNCYGTKIEDSAIEILKKRYARGEINKEEFEKIKKDIDDKN
jgi:uncharacterized membrane protein